MLKGVGKDQEIYTNEKGGKQSKIPYRCDLLPAKALSLVKDYITCVPSEVFDGDMLDPYEQRNVICDYLELCLFNLFELQKGNSQQELLILATAKGLAALQVEVTKYNNCITGKDLSKTYQPSDTISHPITGRVSKTYQPPSTIIPTITRYVDLPLPAVLKCAEIYHEGAENYGAENWRYIDANEHINHALMHIFAYLAKDTQDEHLSHAVCRLLFALETPLRPMGEAYLKFIEKN
jgi:hypothetical protein